jgi:glycosyltransferase involved in cell wall biosynthesis
MQANTFKLSIVTIVLNHRDGLEKTINSIQLQRPDWVETVVIDGKSVDGTVEILKKHSKALDFLISEKDDGISDAFNKGIKNCNGDYILFLNAGDVLTADFYRKIETLLRNQEQDHVPVIIGKVKIANRVIGGQISFFEQSLRNRLPHQGMLIHYKTFEKLGMYRNDFKLGMDYEWSLRLKVIWGQLQFENTVFSIMEPGGLSMTRFNETFRAYHRARMINGMAWLPSMLSYRFYIIKISLGKVVKAFLGNVSS